MLHQELVMSGSNYFYFPKDKHLEPFVGETQGKGWCWVALCDLSLKPISFSTDACSPPHNAFSHFCHQRRSLGQIALCLNSVWASYLLCDYEKVTACV